MNTCGIGTVCRVFYFFHFSLLNCWYSIHFTRCRCSKCKKTHLNGIREHRCCTEIKAANEKFKGLRRIKCITQLEEYDSLTKTIVLENVGALLKDRNGRTYKQRSEQGRNEYVEL